MRASTRTFRCRCSCEQVSERLQKSEKKGGKTGRKRWRARCGQLNRVIRAGSFHVNNENWFAARLDQVSRRCPPPSPIPTVIRERAIETDVGHGESNLRRCLREMWKSTPRGTMRINAQVIFRYFHERYRYRSRSIAPVELRESYRLRDTINEY